MALISHIKNTSSLSDSQRKYQWMRGIPVLALPSCESQFLYSTDSVKTRFYPTWWCSIFEKGGYCLKAEKWKYFFPRLIHIQLSQNVNHKRWSILCIKDQCQSAGKGHRTNRRDQLPQLCWLPNWEHVIPVSWEAQPEPRTCSSDRLTSFSPPQNHSKKYSAASHISIHRSICSFTSQHDDFQNISVNDSISSLKCLHLSMEHMRSVGYMPLSNLT